MCYYFIVYCKECRENIRQYNDNCNLSHHTNHALEIRKKYVERECPRQDCPEYKERRE
jgi:hypothetical protein